MLIEIESRKESVDNATARLLMILERCLGNTVGIVKSLEVKNIAEATVAG